MGGLKEAGLGVAGIGEGSALVAEELGFEEGLRDGGAVHLDEGAVGARRLVEGAGEEALAGPGLAQDQDWGQSTRSRLAGDELRDLGPGPPRSAGSRQEGRLAAHPFRR